MLGVLRPTLTLEVGQAGLCDLGPHSKHWFTTSFRRKVPESDARSVDLGLVPTGPRKHPQQTLSTGDLHLSSESEIRSVLAHAPFDALPTELSSCVSELRSCVKVEEAILGSPAVPNSQYIYIYGLCGRQTTLNRTELCVRAQELCRERSRWPSWALRP